MELKDNIMIFALENAIKFEGRANPGAVIGKILSSNPDLKKDMKNISKKVQEVIKEINSMNLISQKELYEKIVPKEREREKEAIKQKKEETKHDLPDLPNAVMGKVVTRLPPEPSKYNHVGHAISFLINYMYAKKYGGACVLKFEDTNPEKSTQEYVDAMIEDITNYLGIKPASISFVSDMMEIMYQKAEELITKGKAYVCCCPREEMQDLRMKGVACECCNDLDKNHEEWRKMVEGKFEPGGAILRLKGDMNSNNMVMRDPVLFRINKTPHFKHKNKYCCWPLYDFENSISDCELGVTHILRSSEFGEMRNELQNFIKDCLGYQKQEIIHYGRFNITGTTTQGREIRELIATGKVSGWDDPSLVTLKALKRRGITKEVLYDLVFEAGMSMNSKKIDWTVISSLSRKILDKKADRYFFIENPTKIEIMGSPEQNISIDRHPDIKDHGARNFRTKDKFFIAKEDHRAIKDGNLIRLMDCLNFKKEGNGYVFHSVDYDDYKKEGKSIIQWLPAEEKNVEVEIRMPDNNITKGYAEKSVKDLKVDDIIQFQRFGFCRLDSIEEGKYKFWFTHK